MTNISLIDTEHFEMFITTVFRNGALLERYRDI